VNHSDTDGFDPMEPCGGGDCILLSATGVRQYQQSLAPPAGEAQGPRPADGPCGKPRRYVTARRSPVRLVCSALPLRVRFVMRRRWVALRRSLPSAISVGSHRGTSRLDIEGRALTAARKSSMRQP
jgi:hypothetical protein